MSRWPVTVRSLSIDLYLTYPFIYSCSLNLIYLVGQMLHCCSQLHDLRCPCCCLRGRRRRRRDDTVCSFILSPACRITPIKVEARNHYAEQRVDRNDADRCMPRLCLLYTCPCIGIAHPPPSPEQAAQSPAPPSPLLRARTVDPLLLAPRMTPFVEENLRGSEEALR